MFNWPGVYVLIIIAIFAVCRSDVVQLTPGSADY